LPSVSISSLGATDWLLSGAVVVVGVVVFVGLSRFRGSDEWKATVTPLASIIGSGFLVVAPLLGSIAGPFAVFAMAGIVALAYAVGGAIRYNITQVEALVEDGPGDGAVVRGLVWGARTSKVALAFAYVIAVAFYLELLGAFGLRLFGVESSTAQKIGASVLVVLIGGFGILRGLGFLERIETHAVDTKLAVIAALLLGLVVYNVARLWSGEWSLPASNGGWDWQSARRLLGSFLVVQGFETSRYLGDEYPGDVRIRTMRRAQWVSGAIYVTFVGLATVLLDKVDTTSETAIIELSSAVTFVLPYLLVLGAVMSQFSAAVADTIAAGGLTEEGSGGRVTRHLTYGAVVVLVLGLLWVTDLFSIIAYASRAFAVYYGIQTAMASVHAWSDGRRSRSLWFGVLALAMVGIAVFGIPAESQSS
jgi:hypothetical protein